MTNRSFSVIIYLSPIINTSESAVLVEMASSALQPRSEKGPIFVNRGILSPVLGRFVAASAATWAKGPTLAACAAISFSCGCLRSRLALLVSCPCYHSHLSNFIMA